MSIWLDYREHKTNHTVEGDLRLLEGVWSPQLRNHRDILVYLPRSYAAAPERRYPVLFMHDGQNLFDAHTSFSGEWGVDKTKEALGQEGIEAIVVGIPNMGEQRLAEYSPFNERRIGAARGDSYVRFILETLKPLVDRDFRTRPEREATGIMGSSMGGLISLYAFFAYPEAFGMVAALSPSLWFAQRAMLAYAAAAPYVPGSIYLDVGSEEGQPTVRNTRDLHRLLLDKGYRENRDLLYVEDEGAGHSEHCWANRLWLPLLFLLHDLCLGPGHPLAV
ncbi:MAG TPA: alpha/beta hydrolase-fold protein [Herpetosiphonaceae bacterium]